MENNEKHWPTGDDVFNAIQGMADIELDKAQVAYTEEVERLIGSQLRAIGIEPGDSRFRLAARGIRDTSQESVDRFRSRFRTLDNRTDAEIATLLGLIIENLRTAESQYHKVRLRCSYVESVLRVLNLEWWHRVALRNQEPVGIPEGVEKLKKQEIRSVDDLVSWSRHVADIFLSNCVVTGNRTFPLPAGKVRENSAKIYAQYWDAHFGLNYERILELAKQFAATSGPLTRRKVQDIVDPAWSEEMRKRLGSKIFFGDQQTSSTLLASAASAQVEITIGKNASKRWNSKQDARVQATTWIDRTTKLLGIKPVTIVLKVSAPEGDEIYELPFKEPKSIYETISSLLS